MAVPEYSLQDKQAMQRQYPGLGVRWEREFRNQPPEEQTKLFKDMADEALDAVTALLHKRGRHRQYLKTKIKHLARRLKVDVPEARRHYNRAMERLRARALYENYLKHKDFFDWLHTPAYFEHARQELARINAAYERRKREFEEQIANGTEHVVAVKCRDAELQKLFDNPWWGNVDAQFPMSLEVNRMTLHDFKILKARGLIRLVLGNPDTLENHQFPEKMPPRVETQYVVCASCGAVIDYNTAGLNQKLGAKDSKHYKCQRCLGVEPEVADSMIATYRRGGCGLFI